MKRLIVNLPKELDLLKNIYNIDEPITFKNINSKDRKKIKILNIIAKYDEKIKNSKECYNLI
jgi:hypothetical protein